MTENIIYYLILFFFSLIGLGATWDSRYIYKTYVPVLVFGAPLIIGLIYLLKPEYLWFLNIKELLLFLPTNLGDPMYFIKKRAGNLFIMAVVFSIIIYLTLLYRLLFLLKQRITKQDNN